MGKIFLVIVFIAGLKHSVAHWINAYKTLIEYSIIHKRGYHSSEYPDCLCDNCKNLSPEEKEIHKENNYKDDLSVLGETIIDSIVYAVFISGITIIILKYFLIN